jgi:uncharacterized protein (DUF58 family)
MKEPENVRGKVAGRKAVTPLRSALTLRGRTMLGGAVAVAVAGLILRYPELIGLGLAGVAAVLTGLATVFRAPAVRVEREVTPARVLRGGDAEACIRVSNSSRRPLPATTVRDIAGPASRTLSVRRLHPGETQELRISLPTSRRGIVPSGPLLVDRDDGFGLAHRTLVSGRTVELYVRPRPIPLPEIASSLARSVDGPQADTTMEGTLAFHALREYVPGDELRHVHWRASAHSDTLVVKQHVDTAHAALAVVLDVTIPAAESTGRAEAFEVAVDCAASVAVIAAIQRQPLQLVDSAGGSLLPSAARQQGGWTVDDVLDALTQVAGTPEEARSADHLPGTIRRLSAGGRGSLAVVVSTRPMEGLADALGLLAGCYARVLAVRVVPAPLPVGHASRTGRVHWVNVREADELTTALVKARAAA